MKYKEEIRAKVFAGSKGDKIEEISKGVFKIEVKNGARAGAANGRARALLAAHFQTPQKSVILVSGKSTPNKRFLIYKSS